MTRQMSNDSACSTSSPYVSSVSPSTWEGSQTLQQGSDMTLNTSTQYPVSTGQYDWSKGGNYYDEYHMQNKVEVNDPTQQSKLTNTIPETYNSPQFCNSELYSGFNTNFTTAFVPDTMTSQGTYTPAFTNPYPTPHFYPENISNHQSFLY